MSDTMALDLDVCLADLLKETRTRTVTDVKLVGRTGVVELVHASTITIPFLRMNPHMWIAEFMDVCDSYTRSWVDDRAVEKLILAAQYIHDERPKTTKAFTDIFKRVDFDMPEYCLNDLDGVLSDADYIVRRCEECNIRHFMVHGEFYHEIY